jgi:hypothetical protein
MKWLQAKTIEELQSYGSFKDVRQRIQDSLGKRFSLKARSWQELLEAMQRLQSLVNDSSIQLTQENQAAVRSDEYSLYFNSEESRLIYALIELDGEQRLKELGVNKSYYRDVNKAKKWRNELAKIIHPDVCKHPKAALAINKLTELFENMVGQ